MNLTCFQLCSFTFSRFNTQQVIYNTCIEVGEFCTFTLEIQEIYTDKIDMIPSLYDGKPVIL